jgi:hypothetical protein
VTRLYWQALQPLDDDLTLHVAYLDADGAPLYDTRYYPPAAALWYPTSLWEPGLPVLVQTLPWTLDADRFTLAVGVAEGDAGWNGPGRLPVTAVDPALPLLENGTLARLGAFERTEGGAWTPVPAAAGSPGRLLDVRFGDSASGGPLVLDGVTVVDAAVQPGGAFDFTLHWHAAAPLTRDYSLFVHVLDAAGAKVAQLDWQPQDAAGRLPMTAWIAGQPVVDSQSIALPAELAPGSYRAILGVYDWESGARLPAAGADAADGDVAVIADIQVR